jgi:hypothetical protein
MRVFGVFTMVMLCKITSVAMSCPFASSIRTSGLNHMHAGASYCGDVL